jgi:hypothetical protein
MLLVEMSIKISIYILYQKTNLEIFVSTLMKIINLRFNLLIYPIIFNIQKVKNTSSCKAKFPNSN